MSKLYSIYLIEKENNEAKILLFKSGIFYVALDKDAIFLSNTFGFKLTNLNDNIKKCGFPCNSLDKYLKLFKTCNLSINIIDIEKNTKYSLKDFECSKNTTELLDLIKNIDIDCLSISEAYKLLENIKEKANNINLL